MPASAPFELRLENVIAPNYCGKFQHAMCNTALGSAISYGHNPNCYRVQITAYTKKDFDAVFRALMTLLGLEQVFYYEQFGA